jgi:predicted O-methyltransferase YrrM
LGELHTRLHLLRADLAFAASLRGLPARVAVFLLRAQRRARAREDAFSLASAARPAELRLLLELAKGRRAVVELGTGTAWSTVALALADPARQVISYDPFTRPERELYLRLAGERARGRIELREEPDSAGPHQLDAPTEFLFVDSGHDREGTTSAFRAWRGALAAQAVVVFHDYGHPRYPGVAQAIEALHLQGTEQGGVFIWRAP